MKFRCPYCKHEFSEPQANCPNCNKTMKIPEKYLGISANDKKKIKERIYREAEQRRIKEGLNNINQSFLSQSPAKLIVISILLLAGILLFLAPNLKKQVYTDSLNEKDPKTESAIRSVSVLRVALMLFKKDIGRYPTEKEGLKALVRNPGIDNWKTYYVTVIRPDPWHHYYYYAITNNRPIVLSLGKDGIKGTDDDIYPDIDFMKGRLDALLKYSNITERTYHNMLNEITSDYSTILKQ